jgi:hypothetical protein
MASTSTRLGANFFLQHDYATSVLETQSDSRLDKGVISPRRGSMILLL